MKPIAVLTVAAFAFAPVFVDAAGDEIVVRGVIFAAGVTTASVEVPGHHGPKWIKVGEWIGPWKLEGVDFPNNGFTFVGERGEARSASLSAAVSKDARDAWIRATANPMFFMPAKLPPEIRRRWSKLPDEERARIQEYYRNHGWIVRVVDSTGTTIMTTFTPIHSKERSEEFLRQTDDFRATLEPWLAEAMDAVRKNPAIDFTRIDPAGSPRSVFRRFLDSLPPDRRAAWDEMMERRFQTPKFELPPA